MEMSVDFTLRPDLWKPGKHADTWHPNPEREIEARDWLDHEQRRINRLNRTLRTAALVLTRKAQTKRDNAAKALLRGSPTAVLRSLEIGQRYLFTQYRSRTQIAPIVARMADILAREFHIGIAYATTDDGELTKIVFVERTK